MKHLLITTIAAVVLVGCATTQQSAPPAEANTGVTPLHRAASKVHKEIATADLLRKHGGKTGEELKAEGK